MAFPCIRKCDIDLLTYCSFIVINSDVTIRTVLYPRFVHALSTLHVLRRLFGLAYSPVLITAGWTEVFVKDIFNGYPKSKVKFETAHNAWI